MEDDLQWKMTFDGRRTKYDVMKYGIMKYDVMKYDVMKYSLNDTASLRLPK